MNNRSSGSAHSVPVGGDNTPESRKYFGPTLLEEEVPLTNDTISLQQPSPHADTAKISRKASALTNNRTFPRLREAIAWVVVLMQFIFLSKTSVQSPSAASTRNQRVGVVADSPDFLKMNKHPNEYYDKRRTDASPGASFYEPPQVYPKDAGLVSRIWRSNGSPLINPDLHMGSCWCSADEWCMCTPALAVDIILTSGKDHLWLIRRADTGLLAFAGGMTEVGETSEESLHRELFEEMGITLETPPTLFGIYNDPRRDTRRHSTSVVYIAELPDGATPVAGDDATGVARIAIENVDLHEFFIDHKTVLHDYVNMVNKRKAIANGQPVPNIVDNELFKRSYCPF